MTRTVIFLVSMLFRLTINAQNIEHKGEMKGVMTGTDLSNYMLWEGVPLQNLWAIGPGDALVGEITVIDGEVIYSKVKKQNEIHTSDKLPESSPFAVYSTIPIWKRTMKIIQLNTEKQLEEVVAYMANISGIDTTKPFAFRIEGKFDEVNFHIINKPQGEKVHNHDMHNKAKVHFTDKNKEGMLFGFFSKSHQGVYTHKGNFTHIHYVDGVRSKTGHLEKAVMNGNYIFYFAQ